MDDRDMEEDNKADVKAEKMGLTIAFEGRSIQVKVKPDTPLKKVFDAAEKYFGVVTGTLKFTADGERLRPEQTPAEVNLEEGEQIDAHLQQVGGAIQEGRRLPLVFT